MTYITYDGLLFGTTTPVLSGAVDSYTPLSTLVNRMNRWSSIYRNTEEQYLVYDLDEALRNLQRTFQTPWTLQRTTMKIFDGILEYPKPPDQISMAFMENKDLDMGLASPTYTSIKEFYEDPTNKSTYAEIWNGGKSFIGVKNKTLDSRFRTIDECESTDGVISGGDVVEFEIDNSFFTTGNGSLRFKIENDTGVATIEKTFDGDVDALYKRKYFFANIFLSSIPSSITLSFGHNASNYITKVATTQFTGQGFLANGWNLVAFDLNYPEIKTGVIDENKPFNYYAISINGGADGYYNIDNVVLRDWSLMDYYYYSYYNVKTEDSSIANKKYFIDDLNEYELSDSLVCPSEFADVVMYDAMLSSVADQENKTIYKVIIDKRQDAWENLVRKFPSLEPVIITQRWKFASHNNSVIKVYD